MLKVDHTDRNSSEYATLLSQWPGRPLRSPRVMAIAEIDPSLGLTQRVVAVAEAELDGAPGFAVLDATDSRWYSRDEFPESTSASTVLQIHVGSRLLSFPALPTRKTYIKPPAPIPPEQIVQVYERLLDELTHCDDRRARDLSVHGSPLDRSFTAYLDARDAVGLPSGPSLFASTFERILDATKAVASRTGDSGTLFDSFGLLGSNFEGYLDALVAIGERVRIGECVTFFTPHWDHNLGYGQLGTAAFKAGDHTTAERFLLRLKSELENWERCEEMGLLAEIWLARGDWPAARQLMLDALTGLVNAYDKAEPDSRTSFRGWFQTQRTAFLRLFPDEVAALAAAGIPESLDSR